MNLPRKSVAATEIKNRFGDYLKQVVDRGEPLAIERHGKTVAVVVDSEGWRRLREAKEESTPWFESLKELSERISRNHPGAKPFSAAELIRRVRAEEES